LCPLGNTSARGSLARVANRNNLFHNHKLISLHHATGRNDFWAAGKNSTTGTRDALQKCLESFPKTLSFTRIIVHTALAWRFWVFSSATELAVVLCWSCANFVWTLQNRTKGPQPMKGYSNQEWTKENQMGLGQIVPLLLLMLPFMTFAAVYNGRSSNSISRGPQMTFTETMEVCLRSSIKVCECF
jgi:hypothetical protein